MLIEYVPFGDLLGYLRKSRGLNDTYYKDPDIKPKTSLTSQQLMKFAWQIAICHRNEYVMYSVIGPLIFAPIINLHDIAGNLSFYERFPLCHRATLKPSL